jgi:hypothetical protein
MDRREAQARSQTTYHPFHVIGNEKTKEPSEKLACCVTYLKDFDLRCKKFKTDRENANPFYTCNCLDFLQDTKEGNVDESITESKQFQRECVASAMCSFDDTKLKERKAQIINWIRYTDQIKDRKKFIIPFYDVDDDDDENISNENDYDRHRQAISFLNEHRVCRSAIAALLDLHIMYPLCRKYPIRRPVQTKPILSGQGSNINKSTKRKSNTCSKSSESGGDKKHQR